ncbi:hypothetical protein [Streptomyces sp. MP131-18]|uniref:hypothetical protein n=1 Tax=Streptomyces sp. MP131-18 TaxID=1857892 RepID=UPI00097C348C|nr:hypothetical protein [Streptomyces sp. MP131-18]ONK09478.1 hypothetical protein STBA_01780 [Streptomyces sp. MP131-18]
MHEHDDAAPSCTSCHRALHPIEATRWACAGCQQQAAQQLADLPTLHRQLADVLTPGRGAHVVGSRGAYGPRPPADLDVMDLTDPRVGVIATLVSCVRDWVETSREGDAGGTLTPPEWPAGPDARLAALCRWLRWHLDWACGMHPGVGDSLRDIQQVHQHAHSRATGERGERRVTVACPCGGLLRVGASTPSATCGTCGTRYGHDDVLRLPLAPRAMAAAAA